MIYYKQNNQVFIHLLGDEYFMNNLVLIQFLFSVNQLQRIYQDGCFIDKMEAFKNRLNEEKLILKTDKQVNYKMTMAPFFISLLDFRENVLKTEKFSFLYIYDKALVPVDSICESRVKLIEILQKDNLGTYICYIKFTPEEL